MKLAIKIKKELIRRKKEKKGRRRRKGGKKDEKVFIYGFTPSIFSSNTLFLAFGIKFYVFNGRVKGPFFQTGHLLVEWEMT